MNRRNFLKAMIAAGAAPAFVKADSLMKLYVPSKKIILTRGLIVNIGIMEITASCMTPNGPAICTVKVKSDNPNLYAVGDNIIIGDLNKKQELMQVQKIVHNFNWSGNQKQYTRRNISVNSNYINMFGDI